MARISFQEELHRRGMVQDVSDPAGLHAHLESGQRRAYIGFDPTSDSLTVGNLLALMLLRTFQRHGHVPVVLSGGGTGLIGDPSGKSLERPLLSSEEVAANVEGQRRVFERLLDFDGPAAAQMLNNLSWLGEMGFLEALRDVGKHMSVFTMFAKDSVRGRQAEGGFMSYAEFSYQVLQSYDFVHLHREHGVTIQMGGSDQWGNITSGLDLIRKMNRDVVQSQEAFGLTSPLLLDANGNKMGKSEMGAVWLTADKTTPYELYQYFLNLTDEDAQALLPRIGDLPLDEVSEVLSESSKNPSHRLCQYALADRIVGLLHGDAAVHNCRSASRAMFAGDVRLLSKTELEFVFSHVASTSVSLTTVEGGDVVTFLEAAGVGSSRSRIRQLVTDGAIQINGERVDLSYRLTRNALLFGEYAAIRRGAKSWYIARIVE